MTAGFNDGRAIINMSGHGAETYWGDPNYTAAHLAGVIASQTLLPVIGVPIDATSLHGLDALLSTIQMPGGIPVATMAIGKAGAKNAALFAIRFLALENKALKAKLAAYVKKMSKDVEKKQENLSCLKF